MATSEGALPISSSTFLPFIVNNRLVRFDPKELNVEKGKGHIITFFDNSEDFLLARSGFASFCFFKGVDIVLE